LKVCLVGHFVNNPDEGVRNVAKHIANELERNSLKTKKINISNAFSCWREIKAFNPDIVHYILSPTTIGFILTKILSFTQLKAKSVLSAIHSAVPCWKFLRLFRPDVVLTQSYESERIFKMIGCKTIFIPNGANINKFKPVSTKTKQKLREKYNLPEDKFIILHVASLKREKSGNLCRTSAR
jgi:glycosyltransferase involved in cell wall biosynthesis